MAPKSILGKRTSSQRAPLAHTYNLRQRTQNGAAIKYRCSVTDIKRLPVEVRLNLFQFCMVRVDGKTPPLLAALRRDRVMYEKALEVFYSTMNEFNLMWNDLQSPNGLQWFKDMRNDTKEMIKAKINVSVPLFLNPTIYSNNAAELKVEAQHTALSYLPNIKSLAFDCPNKFTYSLLELDVFLKLGFQVGLKQLKVKVGVEGDRYQHPIMLAMCKDEAKEATQDINDWLEINGKVETTINLDNGTEWTSYEWQAGKESFEFLKVGGGEDEV